MRIDHIQLAMPAGRETEARHFFIRLLGMRELPKPELLASRGGCWFEKQGVFLHLGVEADFKPQRKAHPALALRDFDGLAGRLLKDGYPVEWDDNLPGQRRFYTTDPFGNRMEFLEDKTSGS